MRILIIGGTGLLGIALQQSVPSNIQGIATYFSKFLSSYWLPLPMLITNLADKKQMGSVFEQANPDIVIHTAAIANVDFVERNREQAKKINVYGTEIVVELCRAFKSKLIYISSNAVFDGRHPFYSETDSVNPVNYYGRLKVEAENVISRSDIPWATIRPILMYGWPCTGGRDNPATWWIRSLKSGKPIKIVDNVFSKPLPVWSCAEVIWKVIRQQRTGIYHVAGKDHLSLYQFALQVGEVFELDTKLITPVSDSYFTEIAPRPRDTSFDTSKIESELGVKTIGVKDGLLRMKAEKGYR
jgi:dTDP-4-dehydrorhamnose reductase